MNITVVHGQTRRGSTYNITKLLLDALSESAVKINEFFLPAALPHFCEGCFGCIKKGMETCPRAEDTIPIFEAMKESDLLIFDSPCYNFGMSGQLKAFFDHFAWLWMVHRPEKSMFSKTAVVISTAAGGGTGKVIKGIKYNMFYWGVAKTYGYGVNVGASCWGEVPQNKKAKIEKKIGALAARLKRKGCKARCGIQTKAVFFVMKQMQKNNAWNETDRKHWEKAGWFGKEKPWKEAGKKGIQKQ